VGRGGKAELGWRGGAAEAAAGVAAPTPSHNQYTTWKASDST